MPHIYGIEAASLDIVERAKEVATSEVAKHADAVDRDGRFPTEAIAAVRGAGLLGLCVPSELGGLGEGPGTFAAVTEALAQHCASTAMIFVMHTTATQPIVASTTLAERGQVLASIAAGKHLTTLAFSEKGSRSQFWAPVSKLEEHQGSLRTNAFKSWVTTANEADSYVCSAQRPGAPSPAESTLYLLPRTRPGVRVSGAFDGLGLRGNDSTPVSLEDVTIEESELLTQHGQGAPMMLEVVLPWFNVGTAAMANGVAIAALTATSRHMQNTGFAHTGTQLRDLPQLRARLAEMSVRTEQSRALLGHTVAQMASPSEITPLYVLSTRHAAMQAAVDVTDLAMKACGGAAFSRQLGVERNFRDARAGWVMAPTVDHSADFIGRALTGMELFG